MSKMDALRAMREARYAEAQALGGKAQPSGARPAAAKPAPVAPSSPKRPAAKADASDPADGLCGHRSMNGRTCTREHGHAAKSHRYG